MTNQETFGLSQEIITSISRIFNSVSELEEVIVFGSRAKGNYTPGSDIDLALKGPDITFDTVLTVMSKIEKLNLLYKSDVLNYHEIQDKEVIDHINRVGKTLWIRSVSSIPTK